MFITRFTHNQNTNEMDTLEILKAKINLQTNYNMALTSSIEDKQNIQIRKDRQ